MTVSTLAILNAPRQSIYESQRRLLDAQTELSTGRHADVGLHLGGRTSEVIGLRNGFDRNNSIIDMNGLVAAELHAPVQTGRAGVGERRCYVRAHVIFA